MVFMSVSSVGVVGLGNMGLAYGLRLLQSNFEVRGFDLRQEPLELFRAAGGIAAESGAELASQSDLIITSLPGDAALEAVMEWMLPSVAAPTVVVETSTIDPAVKSKAREQLQERGVVMLDATVSGTPESVAAGELALFAGGDRRAFEAVEAALLGFARTARHVGAFGQATRLKLICNLLVTINNVATAEAMSLGIRAGFDPEFLLEAVGESVAGSRIWDLRGAMMVAGDYRPGAASYRLVAKDGLLIEALARDAGAFTPMFQLAGQFHRAGEGIGLSDLDAASLLELYRLWSGDSSDPSAP